MGRPSFAFGASGPPVKRAPLVSGLRRAKQYGERRAVRLDDGSTVEVRRRRRREMDLLAAEVGGRGGRRSSGDRRSGAPRRCRR